MRIRKVYIVTFLLILPVILIMCSKPGIFPANDFDPRLSGGEATVFDATSKALSHEIPGMDDRDLHVHEMGDNASDQTFVTAPAPLNSGLGPIFNNVSCKNCHHNDGKGDPTFGLVSSSMLIRLSMPGTDANGASIPVPGFGTQLQDESVFNTVAEGKVSLTYTDQIFTYPDGSTVTLRKPIYSIANPYIPLADGYLISPRLAPPFFGLGLIQNIPESKILSFADENDADGDGISGRPNYVYDATTHSRLLGRFGLKANTASIFTQVASAYHEDMGLTSSVFPVETSYGQIQYDSRMDDPELPDSILSATTFYIKTLAVPARRNVTDAIVMQGEMLFQQLNCIGCHKPTIQTGIDVTLKAISNQRIHPYTDLLLHDMGEGLSDGRTDFMASGAEWKTPPLWGIGLFQKTNGIPYYLHDGRARTFEEAILWHDGEAKQSRDKFSQLPVSERNAVVAFLTSL